MLEKDKEHMEELARKRLEHKFEECLVEVFQDSVFTNDTTCTSTNSVAGQGLTLETILEAKKLIGDIKDPFEELMKQKGYDPKKGDILVWPKSMLYVFGGLPIPSYIKVNKYADVPYCIKGLSWREH